MKRRINKNAKFINIGTTRKAPNHCESNWNSEVIILNYPHNIHLFYYICGRKVKQLMLPKKMLCKNNF